MEKFIVSARKYRPQTFDTVVGQEHITTTLKNAIKNEQLAHGFLFCGPRGVGKTTCARILAKTINCENRRPDGEACNECHSCVSFNEGTSLNIHELDAASNNSVEDIRSLVDQVRFAPQAGHYKVYIIDEVHMLSTAAFNAFLKTLEEPPSYAIFILATTEKHKILPTILSRCQIFDFKRITAADTVHHLEQIATREHIHADKAALQVIATKSEGCLRDALSILDKIVSFTNGEVSYAQTLEHLNILDADYYFRMLDDMLAQDLAGVMLLFDDIMRKGFEEDLLLEGLSDCIRNILISRDARTAKLLDVVEGFRERYLLTAQRISPAFLVSALNILNETEVNYKAARNKRLHVEMALIRLTFLTQALDVAADPQGVSTKRLVDSGKPVAFRAIPPMQPVKQRQARLVIESPAEAANTTQAASDKPARTQPVLPTSSGNEVVVPPPDITGHEVRAVARQELSAATSTTAGPATAVKVGRLDTLRKEIAGRSGQQKQEEAIALSEERLHTAWHAYTRMLKETRNPAEPSFRYATLRIISDCHFEVVSNNNLEQKFIEQEKRPLLEHLQKHFCSRLVNFSIVVAEPTGEMAAEDKPLTKKEQYLLLAEKYPLVRELKERLKLDLDY